MPFFLGLSREDREQARVMASEFLRIARESRENSLRSRKEEYVGTMADFVRIVVMVAMYTIHTFMQDEKKRQTVAINIPDCPEEEG